MIEIPTPDVLDLIAGWTHVHLDGKPVVWREIPIRAMGKPRMTRRDQWVQRPSVVQSRHQADDIREAFGLNALQKWVSADRLDLFIEYGEFGPVYPHTQKPDLDNILKLVMDALFTRDQAVWMSTQIKMIGNKDRLIVVVWNPR